MSRVATISELRDRIRQIEGPARHGVLPFGVAALDRALPERGLALGAVHEILGAGGDEEDGAAAAGFAAGILARLGGGPLLWCLKRPDLYGPGLVAYGLDPARLVVVRAQRDDDILWAVEEGLRAPGLAAVVGEIGRLSMVAGRRLQLAAERSGVTALLLRRWQSGAEAAAERDRPSAAVSRWRVTALPSTPLRLSPLPPLQRAPLPPLFKAPVPPLGGEGRVKGADSELAADTPLTLPSPPDGGRGFLRSGGRGVFGSGEIDNGSGRWGLGLGRPRWRVELLRVRGGVPALWEVEVADATGHVSLSAALADRSAAPAAPQTARTAAGPRRRAG